MPEQCMCGDPECSLCYPATYKRHREVMQMLDSGVYSWCMSCREVVEETKWCYHRLLCQDCRLKVLGAIRKFKEVA